MTAKSGPAGLYQRLQGAVEKYTVLPPGSKFTYNTANALAKEGTPPGNNPGIMSVLATLSKKDAAQDWEELLDADQAAVLYPRDMQHILHFLSGAGIFSDHMQT